MSIDIETAKAKIAGKKTPSERAEMLIDVLQLTFKPDELPSGFERVYDTAWGFKTRIGVIHTICRIMYEEDI